PYTTDELQENARAYSILSQCFKEMFEWIAAAVKLFLPEEYEILAQYADVLPVDASCPAYPFTNFVVNFNVTTTLHRDWKDMKFCVVVALSDDHSSGGDLCFAEPGVRLQLRNGDIVMFLSGKLTHFNMHFQGI
ncbi:hypothetical protein HYPSUDRAFT_102132, partial [Hypholoma sublateritium FD-334 SS-4]